MRVLPRVATAALFGILQVSIDSAFTALSTTYTVAAFSTSRQSLVHGAFTFSPWLCVFTPPLSSGFR